jgi:uncharacterized protein (DUF1800 family)
MLDPLPASRWNYSAAAHLLNRAGFGGAPKDIQQLLDLGPDEAVAYLVDYERIPDTSPAPDWAKPDSERVHKFREIQSLVRKEREATNADEKTAISDKRRELQQQLQKEQVNQLLELRHSWLERMAAGPRPLQEKLTLFWHGHFATSAVKVRDAYFMWRQIQTFREMASGNWLDMLQAVATNPAMLVWLDQAQSRKEHPNENFARECMELFSLGEGHYTEKDVTEAARAMTGWSLERETESYRYRPFLHDTGVKKVLGTTGHLNGHDVLEIIVAQPQAARFITAKLWKFFASDSPEPVLIDALADIFRSHDNNFKPLLRAMFRSEEFYAPQVVRNQIKSPVQWLVGSVRMLERPLPPAIVSAQMLRVLGQDLLNPPNVKGWDGGVSWITTNTLFDRYNHAQALIMGRPGFRPFNKPLADAQDKEKRERMREMLQEHASDLAHDSGPLDVEKLFSQSERSSADAMIAALEKRFLQDKLPPKHETVLRDYLALRGELTDNDIRHAIRLVMCTPEFQVT